MLQRAVHARLKTNLRTFDVVCAVQDLVPCTSAVTGVARMMRECDTGQGTSDSRYVSEFWMRRHNIIYGS